MGCITLLLQFNRTLYHVVLVAVKYITLVNCFFRLSYTTTALMPYGNWAF
jgi:hypothetical protein